MKLKIVDGCKYNEKNKLGFENLRPELIGKTFKSFQEIGKVLECFETATVESKLGYKNIDKDEDGQVFIQRNWVPEY